MVRFQKFWLLIFAAIAMCTSLGAQDTSASKPELGIITGTVTDVNGDTVIGASVVLQDSNHNDHNEPSDTQPNTPSSKRSKDTTSKDNIDSVSGGVGRPGAVADLAAVPVLPSGRGPIRRTTTRSGRDRQPNLALILPPMPSPRRREAEPSRTAISTAPSEPT